MLTWRWGFYRFVVPLLIAFIMPLAHWNQRLRPALALLPVILPIFVLLLGMCVSQAERPKVIPVAFRIAFNRSLGDWHALDIFARFILMFFEGGVAIVLSDQQFPRIALLVLATVAFVPYILLSLAARFFLLRCYEMIAQEILQDTARNNSDSVSASPADSHVSERWVE